jgi:hypothetical protein
MQLQEDKCRPGLMQLKAEASAMLGVRESFFCHPPSEFRVVLCLNRLASMLHLHTRAQ